MGMFDTVHVKCPACGEILELQSKAGHCILNEYNLDNVPAHIAGDLINRELDCRYCGAELKIMGYVSIWPVVLKESD